MLEPRETDIPALFLVFIVLPLVAYVLLGKWSESTEKKERISLLAQQAAEEAIRVESMTVAGVVPIVPLPTNSTHQCARCFGPTTTRCKRCKSVWYCSGKCQIIHWREVHKHECQQLDNQCGNSSPKPPTDNEFHGRVSFDGRLDLHPLGDNANAPIPEKAPSENTSDTSASSLPSAATAGNEVEISGTPLLEKRSMGKRPSHKSNKGTLNRSDEPLSNSVGQESTIGVSCSPRNPPVKDDSVREKEECHMLQRQTKRIVDARKTHGTSSSLNNEMSFSNPQPDSVNGENLHKRDSTSRDEVADVSSLPLRASTKRSSKTKSASSSPGTKHYKSPKSMMKTSIEQSCSDLDQKAVSSYDSKAARTKDVVTSQGGSAISSMGIMKMIGLVKPSKLERQETPEVNTERHKKVKMLFPYEDFVKFFHYEVLNISPRGLVNCGNSCYANAVLQCLSCTKPLTAFLLRRSHSRSGCVKDWCLMCELEHHIMMLREGGGPLSPSRILSHMRSINCQIGDGSQEDAHEFLRFLVASMQSICLEGLGGENMVDPRLQETTFIQHTFGGRLRSKVKCLRCYHESERSENIMDLTLEIFGWVESLEDALTQFTSPEDLDGENMYRCGRCATYVQARKQLSIQEAPNILTIVLKRFQEGSYGKINKCITFPDMLDMVPYMTGTDDIPPLYMLYAVVVHLDTLNASFSGHYVSYIKDLQGTWFRIDDTEVQPAQMSQVMSEGAYILFYMRSSPRPARASTRKSTCQQIPMIPKHWSARTHKSSRTEPNRSYHGVAEPVLHSNHNLGVGFGHYLSGVRSSANGSRHLAETYVQSVSREYSEATSSDWSLFTSSDEAASFTTESTRDSFSTVDYDAGNMDPISSIFGNIYTPGYPSQKTLACNMFSSSQAETGYFSEQKGSVVECFMPSQPHPTRLMKGKNSKRVSLLSTEAFQTHGMHVKYVNDSRSGSSQTL